ncbi:MAG: hypothetical protein RR949_04475 [Oscillospiraceae bacterium]
MSGLDLSKLGDFGSRMGALAEKLPKEKAALMEELGKMAEEAVDASIQGSGFSDGGSKLSGWQRYHLGSKGGYVAVRPVGEKEGYTNGKNGPGAITRYNETGHAIRKRKSTTGRYRPRIKVAQVAGRHFYEGAERAALAEANRIFEDYAKRMEQELEGLT